MRKITMKPELMMVKYGVTPESLAKKYQKIKDDSKPVEQLCWHCLKREGDTVEVKHGPFTAQVHHNCVIKWNERFEGGS